jgi:citrate/tricarballylate utilization protein
MSLEALIADASRQLTICNSCRYCEGYCAVFPALERRSIILEGDVSYLANLCHDCRACYYACPYTDPHEFDVNLPQVLAEVRLQTYRTATPAAQARRLLGDGVGRDALTALAGVLAVLVVVLIVSGPTVLFQVHNGPGAFYEVVPWLLMVVPGLVLGGYVGLALLVGVIRFQQTTHGSLRDLVNLKALGEAGWESLTLRWLKGGEGGCHYPTSRVSRARVRLHGLVFGGFGLTFLSTTLAAIYQEVFGMLPPYDLLSGPVVTGTVGGVAMIVGCVGLLGLKAASDRRPGNDEMRGLDVAFIVNLGVASATGLLVLAFRETAAMGGLLIVHLGTLGVLYLTAPYSKFGHFVYRYAALIRNRIETRAEGAARAE